MIIFTLPFFIFSCYFGFKNDDQQYIHQTQTQIYHQIQRNWKLHENPPPPHLSSLNTSKMLYVLILDDEYQASPHQCLMKQQWMDKFMERPEVDGVEVYSVNYWENKECNLSSITIDELPSQQINPSAFLLYKSLQLFLQRSEAGWLFIIGDSAYIKVDRFFDFFNKSTFRTNPERETYLLGSCVEERYFFQMLLSSSGLLLSRRFAEKLVKTGNDELWNVSYRVGITADEILSKIADKINVYVPGRQTTEFLGRGWAQKEMYEMLLSKNFSALPKCKIPREYLNPAPGELGLCISQIISIEKMSVWAGARKRFITKYDFLHNAERMLEDLPENLSYYWDRIYPTLCFKD